VHDYYYDDDQKPGAKVFKEFECPDCSAHNPYDDGFKVGQEILCYYCGLHFKVVEREGGFKLKEA
jgi:transcription elongation factor Elf1